MRKPLEFKVETERLAIRGWAPADRPDLERMVGDSEMMRYLTQGRPWPAADVDEFLARQARQLAEHGVCMGPLVLKEGGAVIGVAGIQPLDIVGEYELGWWVWKAFWGRGYAAEAGRALVEFAATQMGLKRLVAVIDPPNAASIRVAEKLGMRYERTAVARETAARRPEVPVVIYAVDW